MQPYNRSRHSLQTTYLNGNFHSSIMQVACDEVLSNVQTTEGDRKTPLPHKYDRIVRFYPEGVRTRWDDFGNGYLYQDYGSFSGSFGTHEDLTAFPVNTVYNLALDRFYENISQGNMNLGIDVIEAHKTKKMVVDALKAVGGLNRMVRNIAKNPTRSFTDNWLAYQYGWKPLLKTVWDLADYAQTTYTHRRVKARARRVNMYSNNVGPTSSHPGYRYTTRASYRAEIGAIYKVLDQRLFDTTRLTSLNPLSLAWEILPYSFVVDWFYDIGGYLNSLEKSLVNGLQLLNGYRTDTYKRETSGEYYGTYNNTYRTNYHRIEARWSVRRTGLQRSVLTSFPRPAIPQVRVDLGVPQLLSAVGLFAQQYLPKRRT